MGLGAILFDEFVELVQNNVIGNGSAPADVAADVSNSGVAEYAAPIVLGATMAWLIGLYCISYFRKRKAQECDIISYRAGMEQEDRFNDYEF
jgi:hypothetical protein|tara:strand:- start:124 stop:399 length:276 start_codon:yes stop_codon:yes gene_type:complete